MVEKKNGRGANLRGKPKIGGRQKGTPNRRTQEALEQQRLAEENRKVVVAAEGVSAPIGRIEKVKKLGKDVLEDYTFAFHAVAATYQNKIATALAKGEPPASSDLAAFKDWGTLVVTTAKALAEFQSPKFKAIMVSTPPDPMPQPRDTGGSNVVQLNDANAMARVYQKMVKGTK